MHKTLLIGATVTAVVAFALPAFAQTSSTTPAMSANTAAKITCVGGAVNAREQALGTAMTSYTAGLNAAYSARATALQQAYTQTTVKSVGMAVKAAWATFNSSTKSARMAWQKSRNTAWSAFRTGAAACKAPGVSDAAHAGSEASGL